MLFLKNNRKKIFSLNSLMYIIKKQNIKKIISRLIKLGFFGFIYKCFHNLNNLKKYEIWIKNNEPDDDELQQQREKKFLIQPKISIIVPVYNTPDSFLNEMVLSILNQTYSNWELCIADGNSSLSEIKDILIHYSNLDKRIHILLLNENKGIAGNSNEAIKSADGEYIGFLDHDDTLAPFALFEVIKALNTNENVDFIYSDEDNISEDGKKRLDPNFKPDFSPDFLHSNNYVCHFAVYKKNILDSIGYFNNVFAGAQDFDLVLRLTEKSKNIIHIPKILYHWRISKSSTSSNTDSKDYAEENGKRALEEHFKRINEEVTISYGEIRFRYRVIYKIKSNPLISIIIPNHNNLTTLKRCINSILKKSTYENYEIVIVENNSTRKDIFEYYDSLKSNKKIKIIKWNSMSFNYSAVNNYATRNCGGEIFIFLNNDTEVISKDWIENMLGHILRKDVGAAGAKLYYPGKTIQHGGVIVGLGGMAGHSHKKYPGNSNGYFGRLILTQNFSAVTGACLMIKREIFENIKGFDEEFALSLNDIDLCLKIRKNGYLIVWTPYAELYHYESKTRGYEDSPEKQMRFEKEVRLFQIRWKDFLLNGDPYYNPNLDLMKEDFSININKKVKERIE